MIVFYNEASFRGYARKFNYSRPRLSTTNRSLYRPLPLSTKKRRVFPPKEKKRKENWSFASGKGQQLSGFLTETCSIHVRAKRTVVSLSWHPSSHDFVKKFAAMRRTRCFFGKSNTELLCDRTQIVRTLTTWRQETFFKKTLSPLQTFHLLLFPFSIRHFEGKSFDYPVLGF